jgi:diguanylate cyclase (GGDEF)-like protein
MDNKQDDKEALLAQVAELESQVQGLEKDLIHDSLTKLKTKAFFEEESKVYLNMVRNLNAGKRRQWFGFKNLSFLFFDVDHFKKINDTYGHSMGDVVLKKIAQTIKKSVRIGDTVARWGGEEIVAILLGADLNYAKTKAEDIRKKIEELVFEKTPELKVTISVGVVSSESSSNFGDLINKADEALYQSKQTGRNKVTAFSPAL